MSRIITLTTDFGLADPWVGIMKGVMLSIDPSITFVDISHEIPPQDIMRGAFCIRGIKNTFPEGTVHLAVIDPGVGSTRDPVIIKTRRYYYVGPNNGLFSFLDSEIEKMVRITNTNLFGPYISVTFHGRDIFAPAAARLFTRPVDDFGPPLKKLERLHLSEPVVKDDCINGEVTYVDHFGNLFTNITAEMLQQLQAKFPDRSVSVEVADGKTIHSISYYYQSVKEGEIGALVNSFGFLELFTPNGNACQIFGIKIENAVTVRFCLESK